MSSSHATVPPLHFSKILSLRCKQLRKLRKERRANSVVLVDEDEQYFSANCLWNGFTSFSRGGGSWPGKGFAVLEERFGVRFVHEGERGFERAYRAIEKASDPDAAALGTRLNTRARLAFDLFRQGFVEGLAKLIAKRRFIRLEALTEVLRHKAATRELLKLLAAGNEACVFYRNLIQAELHEHHTGETRIAAATAERMAAGVYVATVAEWAPNALLDAAATNDETLIKFLILRGKTREEATAFLGSRKCSEGTVKG